MSRGKVILSVPCALLLGAGGAAFGSGYSIYEQGAKAMAMAGAFSARADDPSALFFNPAGITQLQGIQIYGGTTAIFLDGSSFDSTASGKTFDQVNMIAWPSALYYTQKLNESVAWGLGVTSPFGLKTQWGPSFDGRFISRESNLAVGNVNANLAFKASAKWSFAIGIDYAKTDIRELSRNIDLTPLGCAGCEGFSKLTGDGTDTGWNLALHWASPTGWRWGGSYRSKMEPKIHGDVEFENIPAPFAPLFSNGGATATLPLPATFAGGVGYVSHLGRGKWEAEFDVVWTDWSEFDHLRVDIEKNTFVGPIPVVADIDQTEEWHDTYSYRGGFLYHVTPRQDWRVGAYYDLNPIADRHVRPRLPDADRTSVQAGWGFHGKSGFFLDAAYQALFFQDRKVTTSSSSASDPVIPGTYKNFTSLFGVSLGWKF